VGGLYKLKWSVAGFETPDADKMASAQNGPASVSASIAATARDSSTKQRQKMACESRYTIVYQNTVLNNLCLVIT
jgi:hypothetical protein